MSAAELTALVQLLRERGRPENPTVTEMRERYELLGQRFQAPQGAVADRVRIGDCAAEVIAAPGVAADRWVLYLHGGGYVLGSPDTHRNLAYGLSQAADARVLLLDYRLAPEFPFPAAVEDAVAAYRWLIRHGVQAERIALAGDSAGGGLAIATMVVLKDDGDALPAAAACISPWIDLEGTAASIAAKAAEDPIIWRGVLDWFAGLYLAGADPRMPLASPLHAELSGLPPLLVQVGTAECLLDDALRLVERARAGGVDATLEQAESMVHVWHLFAPVLSEGREAIARAGEFVRARTGG